MPTKYRLKCVVGDIKPAARFHDLVIFVNKLRFGRNHLGGIRVGVEAIAIFHANGNLETAGALLTAVEYLSWRHYIHEETVKLHKIYH